MFFLNLTAGEFFGLLGVLGGTITALYFLDRSKRRKVVSTLQFWVSAAGASEQRSRKKVNQPWSLILQLVSLALLLLAIAQLQWGTRAAAGRDHVLLVDTSAWSAAQNQSGTTLRAEVSAADAYLAALPAQDRVLLARVDALAAPATVFTTDRDLVRTALGETVSSLSALDLAQALAYAEQAQHSSGGAPGEIVYVGPQQVSPEGGPVRIPANLRVLNTPIHGANCGIREVDVRRGETDPNSWHAQVALRNYGKAPQQIRLRTQFAGTRFAVRSYTLPPAQDVLADYHFVTNTEGLLTADILEADALAQDNHASLQLPGNDAYAVTVYTRRADLWRPLLSADQRITAAFLDPSALNQPLANLKPRPDLVLLDLGVPDPAKPDAGAYARLSPVPCIWIDPAKGSSPFQVKEVISKAVIKQWNPHALTESGLHARAERLSQATVFTARTGDIPLATASASSSGGGPVVMLRTDAVSGVKMAAIGFDPLDTHLRFTVTTPLLFANLLDWMAPEAVRTTELRAGHVGGVSVDLLPEETAASLKVSTDAGMAMPFTVHAQTLQLFADRPTVAHVLSAGRERVISLTLPDVADVHWTPAEATVATGLPAFAGLGGAALDLWQWLTCLAAAGLVLEWLWFGRSRSLLRSARRKEIPLAAPQAHQEDLVSQ